MFRGFGYDLMSHFAWLGLTSISFSTSLLTPSPVAFHSYKSNTDPPAFQVADPLWTDNLDLVDIVRLIPSCCNDCHAREDEIASGT